MNMTSSINQLPLNFHAALPHPGLRARPLPEGEVAQRALQVLSHSQGEVNSSNTNAGNKSDSKLREVFDDFVGQTFYGQMLSAMRSTLDKPAYFHGGRAEEAFQSQLDQVLAEKMADASAEKFTGPMFDLFSMSRR